MTDIDIRKPSNDFDIPVKKANAVYRMLTNGRRHFGMPSANLTLLDDPDVKAKLPEKWKCDSLDDAKKANENVSNMFLDWIKDKPEAVLIDSVRVDGVEPDVEEDTGLMNVGFDDHILVIGAHILVIDSKAWKGGKDEDHLATYNQDDDGNVIKSGKIVPGGNLRITDDLQAWFNYIEADPEKEPKNLFGMIIIDADNVKVNRFRQWWNAVQTKYYMLVEKERFIEQMNDWYDKIPDYEKTFISTDIITQITMKMCKPYNRRDHVINMKPLLHPRKTA